MIRVVRETYDFNNAICEGNNLLSILTLGMTMVKIMRANGMNDQTIIQHLQGLQEAVRMKQV